MVSKLSNFQQRLFLGLFGIIILSLLIYASHIEPFGYLFVAALCIFQAIALHEFYMLAEKKEVMPFRNIAIIASVAYYFFHYLSLCSDNVGCLALFLFALLLVTTLWACVKEKNAITAVSTTLFGFLYVSLPLSFLIDLNFDTSSAVWIVYLIIATKITDTSAYFAGKSIGSKQIAPILSPKKTVEGALFGLIGAAAFSMFFLDYMQLGFTFLQSALLGVAIGVFAQVGDLVESLFKRDAKVKDSNTLPGFGGMLDILDSLIFTTPLLFFWLKIKNLI